MTRASLIPGLSCLSRQFCYLLFVPTSALFPSQFAVYEKLKSAVAATRTQHKQHPIPVASHSGSDDNDEIPRAISAPTPHQEASGKRQPLLLQAGGAQRVISLTDNFAVGAASKAVATVVTYPYQVS
jgi:hypothetical protein